jgi:hypothetical protein
VDLENGAGRSRKKVASKRPLRRNSGGSAVTSLAVPITKTACFFSCIHESTLPNTRCEVPPSNPPPAKAFSISSIHSTHGAMVSTKASARRVFSSDWPTSPPNSAPTSSRTSGRCQRLETIFAVRLFPVPGMPIRAIPFGAGMP